MKKFLLPCLVVIIGTVVGTYYLEVENAAQREKAAQLRIVKINAKVRALMEDENIKNYSALLRQKERAFPEREKQYLLNVRREHAKALRKAVNDFVYEMKYLDLYNSAVAKSHESTKAKWSFMFHYSSDGYDRQRRVVMARVNVLSKLINANNAAEVDLFNYIELVKENAFKDSVALADSEKRTVYIPHMESQFMEKIEKSLSAMEPGE